MLAIKYCLCYAHVTYFACSCRQSSLKFSVSDNLRILGKRSARGAVSLVHFLPSTIRSLSVCRLSQCTIRIHEMMVEGHPPLLLGRLSQLSFRRGRSCLPALAKRSCQSGIMKQAHSCSCQKPPSAYTADCHAAPQQFHLSAMPPKA